jgi:alpha-N-arabinofuranosidase
VVVSGVSSVDPNGQAIILSASAPTDTNSITEPTKIVPETTNVDGLGTDFTKPVPPYTVVVLEMQSK